jgi:hypothetical protein
MPAELEVLTSRPPRPHAGTRTGTGFAWSCRKDRAENGEPAGACQITGGGRREYERHMRGHGLKPHDFPSPGSFQLSGVGLRADMPPRHRRLVHLSFPAGLLLLR